MADPIDLITANPDENDPANIAVQIDLFVQQIKASIPQLNAAFTALNFLSTSSVSSSSLAIDAGNKSLSVDTGKSYVPGMTLRIANTADVSKWMQGEVVSYDSGTGALVVVVTHTNGSGTLSAWTVSLSARIPVFYTGDQKIIVYGDNGHGSTNTRIRRFATVLTNLGSNITYADSATLGGSFTINNSGIYSINYSDRGNDANSYGVSINSGQLTTNFISINEVNKLFLSGGSSAATGGGIVTYLTSGDVLRSHTDGSMSISDTRFQIERIL
ncbi:MAG: hypothetical protein LV471_11125 [Nitrosomonas sp.]|nr:hypothetical protein [Nitrosomonas sp.]